MPDRAAALALLLIPLGASAFQEPTVFDAQPSPISAGGGSVHFTGSPAARGYDCSSCHVGDVGTNSLQVTTNPPDLMNGSYEPGTIYQITVQLLNEHHGLDKPTTGCGQLGGNSPTCNWNGMAAEIADSTGRAAGALCPHVQSDRKCDDASFLPQGSSNTFLSQDQTQVYGVPSPQGGDLVWTFWWQAPQTSAPVTLYVGSVDGDGGGPIGGTPPRDGTGPDIDGDGVATLAMSFNGPGSKVKAGSCGYLGEGPLPLWAAAAAFVARRRARCRRR